MNITPLFGKRPRPMVPPSRFLHDVLNGLTAAQKTVPARYLYDSRGSALFEEITQLPEYYPTRTELDLLSTHGPDIARLAKSVDTLVEFGAGSARKTPTLIEALSPGTYIPVDVAGPFLREAAGQLAAKFPGLLVLPLEADFTQQVALPLRSRGERLLGFFPGSTIGNLAPAEAVDLLRGFARLLGAGAGLLIGIDTRKDPEVIKAAYNDATGVTAAFNLNLVERINRELGGTLPIDALRHVARWNDQLGRIEMHLEARRDFAFQVGGHKFDMRAGETIHTENSHKYRAEEAAFLARASHWLPQARWTDAAGLFSLEYWRAADRTPQP